MSTFTYEGAEIRPLHQYPGYFASEDGKILIDHPYDGGLRELMQQPRDGGTPRVRLVRADGTAEREQVTRLVWEAFVGPLKRGVHIKLVDKLGPTHINNLYVPSRGLNGKTHRHAVGESPATAEPTLRAIDPITLPSYFASSQGGVVKIEGSNKVTLPLSKQRQVTMHAVDGANVVRSINRLIYQAFHGEIPEGEKVFRKDFRKPSTPDNLVLERDHVYPAQRAIKQVAKPIKKKQAMKPVASTKAPTVVETYHSDPPPQPTHKKLFNKLIRIGRLEAVIILGVRQPKSTEGLPS